MKLKLKIMCAVLMLVGVCAPAFSTDYAPIFRKMMKVEPAKASIEQMRNFYDKSPWSNEAKAEMMVQMASWKGISMYTRLGDLRVRVPNVKFLDFALTIENQLYAEEDSILDPIYRDTILEKVIPDASHWFNKEWQKDIDKILGNKTVRVGKVNVRASWVARGALFQAALRYAIKELVNIDSGKTEEGAWLRNALMLFAVNNTLFGANSVERQKLMSDLLKQLTRVVSLCWITVETSGEWSYVRKRIPHAGKNDEVKALYDVETMMKRNGGKGLDPKDPNLKRMKDARNKILGERVRQLTNTVVKKHEFPYWHKAY